MNTIRGTHRPLFITTALGVLLTGFAASGADEKAAEIRPEHPVVVKDATLFRLLGIDAYAVIHDRFGRPDAIGGSGRARAELPA